MNTHNQFSIDLNRLKSKAKRRLKLIKQGDHETLIFVNSFHPATTEISIDDIRLSDVQLALAREIGLTSWPKLKAHADDLQSNLRAIHSKDKVLDGDMETLHVRCGNDIQARLKTCGFEGTFLALIDPLCMGPIPSDANRFVDIRAHYVVDTLLSVIEQGNVNTTTAEDIVKSEQKNIELLCHDKFKRIVFWVEHDSYDQLMLLRGLRLLEQTTNKIIEIIELSDFPGTQRFTGIGQLPVEAIRSCWQKRRTLESRLFVQVNMAWHALTCGEPYLIISLINHHELDCFPNLEGVFRRILQELPGSKTGLSFTQHLALSVLSEREGKLPFRNLFQEYQKREPLPYLGDVMFYALLSPLTKMEVPLLTIDNHDKPWQEQLFALSICGRACLTGKLRVCQEYWVAGIRNNKDRQWSWDHQNLNSLKGKPCC